MTSRSLSNYYRDEIDDIRDNASDGKSFDYKAKYQENQKQDLHSLEMEEMLTHQHEH